MRFKQYLNELYLSGVIPMTYPRINLKWVEFFVNPSKKEMKDASGGGGGRAGSVAIRFIADLKKKKVYVWHPHFMHHSAWKEIGDKRVYSNDVTLLAGIAEERGSNWVMTSSTGIGGKPIEDWKWVEKYIKISNFLKTYRGPDLGI